MANTYQTAVENLYALGHELANTPSDRFNLAHMRAILRELGNPERRFASVLIAGTNGKGSTAATLASILRAAGHRTGLYISPHMLRVNERIRINGAEISEEQFGDIHQRVEAVACRLVEAGELPWHPSFFEVLTAMAFDYFAGAGVEIAVLEVGMGGRLDATNVVEPAVSVITDIALDHQKFLGETITQIAHEKAGIIRPGGVVVTLPQHPEANDVIGNTIAECGAHAVSAVPYVPPVAPGSHEVPGIAPNGVRTSYPLRVLGEEIVVDSPLVGRHQLRNTALAIAAAVELNQTGFPVTARDIERGIRETRWPGRFQRIAATAGSPEIILDVAHNPAGAWALRSALSEYAGDRPLVLVFGVMRDKSVAEIAEILFPLAECVIATRAENPRSASPEEIREAAARTGAEVETASTVAAALARASELVERDGIVVVTGSIYVVGEALGAIQ
ncbi:MAG TPA: folylpolyglutamate synthase/dihydrofolate synthase family protein [Terriglobales bacterium]|jgi:dihydrofolate synthase/folylpolyglutamate synthase|nr:folylpolyglutamate synthase/dihydrofolate synthase family protein [Terriglobales bacterium]